MIVIVRPPSPVIVTRALMACRGLGGRLANAAPPPFPFKLYDLVEAAVERGICSWTSTEFVVWDKELHRVRAHARALPKR